MANPFEDVLIERGGGPKAPPPTDSPDTSAAPTEDSTNPFTAELKGRYSKAAQAPSGQTAVSPTEDARDRTDEIRLFRPADYQKLQNRAKEANQGHFQKILDSQQPGETFSNTKDSLGLDTNVDISMSDNDKDIRAKFQAAYPGGEIQRVNAPDGSPTLIYKKSEREQWHELTANAGGLVAAASDPRVGLGIIAGAATGGAGVPLVLGGQALAGAAGSILKDVYEKSRGYESDLTPGDIAGRAVGSGAMQAGGALIPEAYGVLKSVGSAIKNFSPTALVAKGFRSQGQEFGSNFVRAAGEEGLEEPTIGQVSDSPDTRSKYAQTMVRTAARQKRALQDQSALNWLQAKRDQNLPLSTEQLERLQQLQKDDLTDTLEAAGGIHMGTDMAQGGVATRNAIDNYTSASQASIDQKIAAAESMAKSDEVHFNAVPLKTIGNQMESGTFASASDGTGVTLSSLSPKGQALIGKISRLDADMRNTSFGKDIPPDSGAPAVQTQSALKQLTDIRRQAQDLIDSSNIHDVKYGQAIFDKTQEMLENPIGGTPELTNAIRDITNAQAEREGNLQLFRGRWTNQNGEALQLGITQPKNVRQLTFIRDNQPKAFATLQDSFRGSLLSKPEGIETVLGRYRDNPEVLDMLMPRSEQDAWRSYAQGLKQLEGSDTAKLLHNYNEISGPVKAVWGPGGINEVELDELVRRSQAESGVGDKWESPAAKSFRYGIYKNILDQSTEVSGKAGGVKVLNTSKAMSMVKDVLDQADTRLESVLSPEHIKSLENFQVYLSMLDSQAIGGQLQQGASVAKLFSLYRLIEEPKGYALTLAARFNNDNLAKIFSLPASNRLITKGLEEGPTQRGLSMFAGAFTAAAGRRGSRDSEE